MEIRVITHFLNWDLFNNLNPILNNYNLLFPKLETMPKLSNFEPVLEEQENFVKEFDLELKNIDTINHYFPNYNALDTPTNEIQNVCFYVYLFF